MIDVLESRMKSFGLFFDQGYERISVLVAGKTKLAPTTEPIMAKKKPVSKKTYHTLNIVYHMICLSGLIWQVTQISVNFFKYDVLKDINVIMPEELEVVDRVTYVCLWNYQIVVIENYARMMKRKIKKSSKSSKVLKSDLKRLTMEERFIISPTIFNLTNNFVEEFENSDEFIFREIICYQLVTNSNIVFKMEWLINVSEIHIARGQQLPFFDHRRLIKRPLQYVKNQSVSFSMKSYQYLIKKLKSPYNDKCVNYKKIGFTNRMDALSHCLGSLSSKNDTISQYHFVRRNDSQFLKYRYEYSSKPLEDELCTHTRYPDMDCEETIHLTQIDYSESNLSTPSFLTIKSDTETDPSFTITSKPRIDDIDYVTYIFGALGAWIGFSWITINPLPYVLSVTNDIKNISTLQLMVLTYGLMKKNQMQCSRINSLEGMVKKLTEEKEDLIISKNEILAAIERIENQSVMATKRSERMFRQMYQEFHTLEQKIT